MIDGNGETVYETVFNSMMNGNFSQARSQIAEYSKLRSDFWQHYADYVLECFFNIKDAYDMLAKTIRRCAN